MSHVALQRVAVRMLWDPAFVERVYATPKVALAGDDLETEEVAWLTRPDRRAWSTDPHRRARTLHGLLEEFPGAGALAARRPNGVAALDRFFSSTTFHACIRDGASLAIAFGAYLAREVSGAVGDPRVRALASVEGVLADLRRAPRAAAPAGGGDGSLVLRPRARVLDAPSGAAPLLGEIARRLASQPGGAVAAIAAGARGLDDLPALAADHVLTPLLAVMNDAGEASLEELPGPLAAVLRHAARRSPVEDLLAIARHHGAEPGEDREIVEELVADGILVRI